MDLLGIGKFFGGCRSNEYGSNSRSFSTVNSTADYIVEKMKQTALLVGGSVIAVVSVVGLFFPNSNIKNGNNRKPQYRDNRENRG